MTLRFFLPLLCFVLVACNSNPLEVVVSRCPAVAIVGDAGVFTRFEGAGRSIEDIAYTATLTNLQNGCEQKDDVTNWVGFDLMVQSGAALQDRSLDLSYFIVVLKDNNQIVSKKVYEVAVALDQGGRGQIRQRIEQIIPTVEQARRYNYEVLVGWQTDPEDISYNMHR